jgi:superfamily I DNA/RNA helicase
LELPEAVRSTGVAPVDRVVAAADLPAAVAAATEAVLDEVEGTVGVITPVPRRDEVAGWLRDLPAARLQVVTSLEAKGMEYDGVVLVEPGQIRGNTEAGVRTLYVALSRATQRLTTVGTDLAWLDRRTQTLGRGMATAVNSVSGGAGGVRKRALGR